MRIALLELEDLIRQNAVADRGDRAEVDGVPLLLIGRLHEQQRFVYLVHDLAGALAQENALGRDDHIFLVTDEELAAQLLLQPLELKTQRRLGNAKGIGGFGDAAVFGDGKKVFELLERHDRALPLCISILYGYHMKNSIKSQEPIPLTTRYSILYWIQNHF